MTSFESITLKSEPEFEASQAAGAPAAGVRPLLPADLPQLGELYRRACAGDNARSIAALEAIFFGERHQEGGRLSSLGFEDERGRLIGCIGVTARRMKFGGRAVLAAIGHNFIVDPTERISVGAELARRFLSGPQDLSLV